MSVTGDELV